MSRTRVMPYLVISASLLAASCFTFAQNVPPATTSQQAVAYAHASEADPLGPQADQGCARSRVHRFFMGTALRAKTSENRVN
jgi:hypothetical protein